jgi:hypothetical protein
MKIVTVRVPRPQRVLLPAGAQEGDPTMRNVFSLGVLVAATGVFFAGEHDEGSMGPSKTYVGKVGDGGAMIGVVTQGKSFLAYVCSDDDGFNASQARWFRGEIGEKGAIRAVVAGATLAAEIADGKVKGALSGSDKKELKFTASAVKESGHGGVFRAEAVFDKDHYVAGWVRDDDGATVGAQGKAKSKLAKAPATGAKGAPATLLGEGKKAKAVTGELVDALETPLPGELLGVTVASIDAKKNELIVKTDDGKVLSLPGDKLSTLGPDGKRRVVSLGTPSGDLRVARRLHINIKCLKRDKKTGRCNDRDISIFFD